LSPFSDRFDRRWSLIMGHSQLGISTPIIFPSNAVRNGHVVLNLNRK
jgi:hypothetical protein